MTSLEELWMELSDAQLRAGNEVDSYERYYFFAGAIAAMRLILVEDGGTEMAMREARKFANER